MLGPPADELLLVSYRHTDLNRINLNLAAEETSFEFRYLIRIIVQGEPLNR